MSQNESAQNDKNIKNFAIINKVAAEYVQESNEIRKDILYRKLWEKCLAYLLRLDATQDDTELEGNIYSGLYSNEEKRDNKGYDLNKAVDMDVFIETITYAIGKYTESPGEEFTRLFSSTYKIRKIAAIGNEGINRKLHGLSSSNSDKQMFHAFNKLIKDYLKNDERFIGKKLHDLSRQDIHDICVDAGVEFKAEERYIEIAQQFVGAERAISLDKPIKGEESEDATIGSTVPNNSSSYEEVIGQMYIINLFRHVINMASKIQKPYFVCFITLELFNNYQKALPKEMKALINNDFWDYVNDYANSEMGSTGEVPDALIAKFLKVKAPAISKKRDNFKVALDKARSMLEK
ncbi:hypothetical protein [Anaerovibrio sp. RM50]|uniref:hypothetical protein n=1 Tax=Anaerovibrio sp. RM50 TaxID=1200557 RepID=UPI0004873505|nr:hypothetical protein [Anaerovibrio sp. RM50]